MGLLEGAEGQLVLVIGLGPALVEEAQDNSDAGIPA